MLRPEGGGGALSSSLTSGLRPAVETCSKGTFLLCHVHGMGWACGKLYHRGQFGSQRARWGHHPDSSRRHLGTGRHEGPKVMESRAFLLDCWPWSGFGGSWEKDPITSLDLENSASLVTSPHPGGSSYGRAG